MRRQSVCRGKRLDVLPWSNYDTSVLRVQGYQFEALPNGEQLRNLRRFAGSCRFVYNQALFEQATLRRQRKAARLCGHVRFAAKLEDRAPVAFRCPVASVAAIFERFGASLHKLLPEASRLSGLPQEGPQGFLSYPARIRGRQQQRAYLAAQDWLDALPQVTRH